MPPEQLTLHRAEDRGKGEYGWLSTRYSFSFADWYEPSRMGFGALRVLNDDTITEGSGFGMHGHANMEIITIVLEGALAHKDSMGETGVLVPGDVQVMSAGTGILHSEYNGGQGDLKLFQIWIAPDTERVTPRYDQRSIGLTQPGETLLVASMGDETTLTIHQDAYLSRLTLDAEHPLTYRLKKPGHGVYFFVITGPVTVAETRLDSRDAFGVEGVDTVSLSAKGEADVLAIEVPM